ncbi:MAG: hypothetical protein ACLR13_09925 [Acutalibacteraceae bacterium]
MNGFLNVNYQQKRETILKKIDCQFDGDLSGTYLPPRLGAQSRYRGKLRVSTVTTAFNTAARRAQNILQDKNLKIKFQYNACIGIK